MRVAVSGDSMLPTLRPGDWLLVRRGAGIRAGDVLLARSPEDGDEGRLIVKRALRRTGEGWWLESDNQAAGGSRDSWIFGTVPDSLIVGRVVFRYWPLSRVGGVPRLGSR